MTKRLKRAKRKFIKPVLLLIVVMAVAAGIWQLYIAYTGPKSGRNTFTFTQRVGETDNAACVHLTYYNKDYCIDEWSKVYSVLDKQNQTTSSTIGTTVKVVFDADFHTGSKMFVGNTETPTIFLDKVYSASATKQ